MVAAMITFNTFTWRTTMRKTEFWATRDYLDRIFNWLGVQLLERTTKASAEPLDLRGYRIRFIIDNSLEIFAPEKPVEVYMKKKMILLSFDYDLYGYEDPMVDLAEQMLDGFFDGCEAKGNEAVELLFSEEDDDCFNREDFEDVFTMLINKRSEFASKGIYSIDFINPYNFSDEEDCRNSEKFCLDTLSETDVLADKVHKA